MINSNDNNFKVIFVGDTNVGKSSIIYYAVNGCFSPNIPNTTGSNSIEYTKNIDGKLIILDTAGQEVFRSLTSAYFRESAAVIIVYSVDNESSLDSIKTYWMNIINDYDIKVRYLVENKIDLRDSDILSVQVNEDIGNITAEELDCAFMRVSAKNGIGIQELFQEVFRSCYDQKIGTLSPPQPQPQPIQLDPGKKDQKNNQDEKCC